MEYREFGESIDWKPSALGFGMMRLPTVGDDSSNIDVEKAGEMVKYAIDHGVNYFDTAWPYHDGESEGFVGNVLDQLGDDYRDEVRLATKMPSWKIEEKGDFDYYFNKQLENLRADHIDFYLLHGLTSDRWETYQELNVFDWIEKMKDEGKIDYIGFSFHDDFSVFKDIVDGYDWDFCQIQYNYLDHDYQAGSKGLKYAAAQGIGTIIMEPLRGGQLATDLPESVKEVFENTELDRPPVEWALRWLWSQPEVSLVLSGMSTIEQVRENVEIADRAGHCSLSEKEEDIIERLRDKFRTAVKCTRCNYCMPCPNGVEIPKIFELYNKAKGYGNIEEVRKDYYEIDEGSRASDCIACGQCEEVCPQNLPIIVLMEEISEYFQK